MLPCATQAAFDSYAEQHNPFCLHDTRADVLSEIIRWAEECDEAHIFWLSGLAGTGKSTVARTITREFQGRNRLGASFFFSRSEEDQSHTTKFFTTIAVQLANKSSALKDLIYQAVDRDPDIACKALGEQWNRLVLQPLSMLKANSIQSPLILVVDALDECDDDRDVRVILNLLAEAAVLETIQLRIFVTSRPETPILLGFRSLPGALHRDLSLHNIPRAMIDNDILIFFEHKLREIRNASDYLPVGWPGKEATHHLVSRSNGLFVYAAILCRFIEGDVQQSPDDLLRLLLDDNTTDSSLRQFPTKTLDMMYTQILQHSVKNVDDRKDKQRLTVTFKQVVGAIVILFDPLSTLALARLLDMDQRRIHLGLHNLRSILEIPDNPNLPLRLFHPSFRDFLLDKQRSADLHFWLNEKKAHGALADSCLRLMSGSLKKDICSLRAPGALASEVDNNHIEQCLPTELQYACRYWVQHFERSEARLHGDGNVLAFLRKHLLHWLEALSWMGKTSEGVLAITSLESITVVRDSLSIFTKVPTNI